jgi:hypothetical protein
MPPPMCVYFHYLSSLKKYEDAISRSAFVRGAVAHGDIKIKAILAVVLYGEASFMAGSRYF